MAQRVIIWARKALDDIDEACAFVGQSSPESLSRLSQKIENLVNDLLDNPYIGRKIPEFDQEHLRERIFKNFRILYRVTPNKVECYCSR